MSKEADPLPCAWAWAGRTQTLSRWGGVGGRIRQPGAHGVLDQPLPGLGLCSLTCEAGCNLHLWIALKLEKKNEEKSLVPTVPQCSVHGLAPPGCPLLGPSAEIPFGFRPLLSKMGQPQCA